MPLSIGEFAELMTPFGDLPKNIALAISGGPDSMALAICAQRWAEQTHHTVIAFIVDHGLRAESAAETTLTQERLQQIGIPSQILHWKHTGITRALHITARKARMQLLSEACISHCISHLMLAHHKDDQAETILMRLAKGSGIDGLAGIASRNVFNGVHILRPFLMLSKERLITTCEAEHLPFVTDASNNSSRFARGRLRRVLPLLAEEGLTVDRLVDLGGRARLTKDALDHYTKELIVKAIARDISGALHCDLTLLRGAPRAISERALTAALQHIHLEDYPPEHASLSLVCTALCSEEPMPIRTLHRCVISKHNQTASITRELSNDMTSSIQLGENILWDQRWQVELSTEVTQGAYHIKPIGLPQHRLLDQLDPNLSRKVPLARARAAMPGLWQDEKLIAVPTMMDSGPTGILKAKLIREWPEL